MMTFWGNLRFSKICSNLICKMFFFRPFAHHLEVGRLFISTNNIFNLLLVCAILTLLRKISTFLDHFRGDTRLYLLNRFRGSNNTWMTERTCRL
jgi:hypothetical protein